MKHHAALFLLLLGAGLLNGQTQTGTISTVKIYTEPAGVRYLVDGKIYDKTTVFAWPTGSNHTLSAILPEASKYPPVFNDPTPISTAQCKENGLLSPGSQMDDNCDIRWDFAGWTDSAGKYPSAGSPVITIVADPSVTYYKAAFQTSYRIQLIFYGEESDPPAGPNPCVTTPLPTPPNSNYPGMLVINGGCYWTSGHVWVPANSAIPVVALPYEGFVFSGFSVNGGPSQAFLSTVNVQAPLSLRAKFEPGKSVRFLTEPRGFSLLVDRTETLTPPAGREDELVKLSQFWWADGSQHVLAARTPQVDREGTPWFLDGFTTGGGLNSVFTVSEINVPMVITAKFIRGAFADIFTKPAGLKIKIDGRDNYMGTSFAWPIGSKHTLAAPAEQVDTNGRRYRFKGWSNGGAATQEVVIDEAAVVNSLRMVATYEMLGQVVVRSSMLGTTVKVDGADCETPCVIDRAVGESVKISAASKALTSQQRIDFSGWSDGGAAERTVQFQNAEQVSLSAVFRKSFLFQNSVDPMGGATLLFEPVSADNFFPEGTQVTVTAQAKPGYRFRRWEGDVSGTYKVASIKSDAPHVLRAVMDIVPYLAEGGVRNAAGDTPDAVVAAGSLVSIFGASLAADYAAGPSSPLVQTLGGVAVRMQDRYLPLLFVSPTQINAQLPSDLEEGAYSLTVVRQGYQDITGKFTVARNAPGLFSTQTDSGAIALGVREDGKMVALKTPARKGQLVSLFATGLGPYDKRPPDGFAVPQQPAYQVADAVQVVIGDRVLDVDWAGAAPGYVGMALARFRLPDDIAGGQPLDVKLRINGRESNAVSLPIEP